MRRIAFSRVCSSMTCAMSLGVGAIVKMPLNAAGSFHIGEDRTDGMGDWWFAVAGPPNSGTRGRIFSRSVQPRTVMTMSHDSPALATLRRVGAETWLQRMTYLSG